MRGLIVAILMVAAGPAEAENLFEKFGIHPPDYTEQEQEFAAELVRCAAIGNITVNLAEEKSSQIDEVKISAMRFLAAASYWDYLMTIDGKAKSFERIEANFIAQVGYWSAHYSMSAENPDILTKIMDAIDVCRDLAPVRDHLVVAAELAGFDRE